MKYAQFFEIKHHEDQKTIEVFDHDKERRFSYRVIDQGSERKALNEFYPGDKSIAVTSPGVVASLSLLGLTDHILLVPNAGYLHNKEVVKSVEEGRAFNMGEFKSQNLEIIAAKRPDIFFSVFTGSFFDEEAMNQLSIPLVGITSHLENHPLGRLEWIKFYAAFFNLEDKADSIFSTVESAYHNIQNLYISIGHSSPKVMAGYYKKGFWVAPGGKSYIGKLLEDAGAAYLYAENNESGNININIEKAYVDGMEADVVLYLRMGSMRWSEILESEPVLSNWPAVAARCVFSNEKQVNSMGRNNYWEQGVVEPHIILSDLAKILWTEVSEDLEEMKYFTHIR